MVISLKNGKFYFAMKLNALKLFYKFLMFEDSTVFSTIIFIGYPYNKNSLVNSYYSSVISYLILYTCCHPEIGID